MRFKKKLRFFLLSFIFLLYFYVSAYAAIPEKITLIEGKECEYPFYSFVKMDLDNNKAIKAANNFISSSMVGKEEVKLSLFGIIPFKTVSVNILSDSVVLCGGQIIGMKLNTTGLVVVTFEDFYDGNYKKVKPYQGRNIERGDMITQINGEEIESVQNFIQEIQKSSGDSIILSILRNGKVFQEEFTPIIDRDDGKYKLGFWVKSVTAGVGTVTFVDPDTRIFGALGHGINDINEMDLLNIKDGEAYNAFVLSVVKGKKNMPGEIKGAMRENDKFGTIIKNTRNGVFGKIDESIEITGDELFIGLKEDVIRGHAQIFSTVSGKKCELYDIEIERTNLGQDGISRNMVIRIVDDELLNKTGGIVQGMSGSPIIQNGKLIGAVTHVLVNDPTMGYGVFIENMLDEVY